jgi:hypothetical protein
MVSQVRCPSCRALAAWDGNPHRPFCSDRCRQLDLGAWLTERYRVAGEKVTEIAESSPSNGDDGVERNGEG